MENGLVILSLMQISSTINEEYAQAQMGSYPFYIYSYLCSYCGGAVGGTKKYQKLVITAAYDSFHLCIKKYNYMNVDINL